jgi:hypothetical protein
MRELLPGAHELVYDNYNYLVVGFDPTERPSDAVFSVVVHPVRVSLCFLQNGVGLPDPEGLLRGSGRRVRNVLLPDAATLDEPAVRDLMGHALARASLPFDPFQPNRLIIRSISAKQRPRRPAPPSQRHQGVAQVRDHH